MNMNIKMITLMKTISMVDLRTDSERIVRELKRGERMILSYRGEPLAELVPSCSAKRASPLEALMRARELTAGEPGFAAKAFSYLKEVRTDQEAWSERARS
jgi:antitoxin (DNA-binding transcriptional repressor) of toxin-antitoxin stability system